MLTERYEWRTQCRAADLMEVLHRVVPHCSQERKVGREYVGGSLGRCDDASSNGGRDEGGSREGSLLFR